MNANTINDAVTMRPGSGASLGRIDQYELVRELGGGGFGCVYLARDTVAGIDVAVKGLPPLVRLNKEELENIRRNFALVSRLHHPNIAAALTLHPVANAVYADKADAEKLRVFQGDTLVVMQYAPGVTLSRWRKQFPVGKVPLDQALDITRQIASALDYAHEEKILHRDIKPANVMIETASDGKITARVLDFGLAAEIRSSMGRVSREITDTSGTRPYMAPEQWLGGKQGRETDQYSLAALFYELVTGEVPFASVFETGDPVLMMNVVGREPPDLPRELSKPVRVALTKALAKKREERFSSCTEFVDALVGRGLRPRRGQWGLAAGLAFLAAVIAGGIWVGRGFQPRREAEGAHPECAPYQAGMSTGTVDVVGRVVPNAPRRLEDKPPYQSAQPIGKTNAAEVARIEAERKAMVEKARLAAEKAAEETKRKAEAEKARLASEKARIEAEEMRKREAQAAEARRRAEREAEARKEKERLKAAEESRRKAERDRMQERTKRDLYQTLATVETALEKFRSFEYSEAIRDRCDALASRYKAVKTAMDADDLSMAVAMAKELKEPKDAIEAMLPSVRAFYRLKADVDRSRDDARACEAPVYAKAEYDRAEKAYGDAVDLAKKRDYVRAAEALKGCEDDFAAAKTAAEANPESIYRKGLDAWKKRDFGQAAGLFGTAAEKGHPAALTRLGLCHLKGSGLPKDEKRAFDCFGKAACLNHAQAQYFLGGCYAKSIGTRYDKAMSRAWMAVAAVNGSKAAEDFLKKADWSVSAEERRGIREMLKDGRTGVSLPGELKQVVQHIYDFQLKEQSK